MDNQRTIIAIDNGITGVISALYPNGKMTWDKTPIMKRLNYTQKKQWISRIDTNKLRELLAKLCREAPTSNVMVVMERPAIGPDQWFTSLSAVRSLEATLIVLEDLALPYQIVDSRKWQHALLPKGLKGKELKAAANEFAKRMYPTVDCHGDADSLCMAHWAKQEQL